MPTLQSLIFSDLDGTLLDHFTYQSTAAHATLRQLKTAGIPVILTTSKTFAEVSVIQQELKIEAPFITENGAAIFIPKSTFADQPKQTVESGQYWVKSFCQPRQHWLNLLAQLSEHFKAHYQGFSELSTEQLIELTGLNEADAQRAKERDYGEPVHWFGDKKIKKQFIKQLEALGATVLHGGRFIHVCGDCDKGLALKWLTRCYQQQLSLSEVSTIALGDGENDVAMLEAATTAVQIRSPVHAFPVLKNVNKDNTLIQTKQYGPVGWAQAIQALLFKQSSFNLVNSEVDHG